MKRTETGELLVMVQEVVGSNLISHPNFSPASLSTMAPGPGSASTGTRESAGIALP